MICYAVSYSMLFIRAEISYLIPLHGNDVSGEVLLSTYIINRNTAQKTINAKWMVMKQRVFILADLCTIY